MRVRVVERFFVEGFFKRVLDGSFTSEKLNDFDALRVMVKVCFIFSVDCHSRINNSSSREDAF